jgi:MFS family permease
MQQLAQDKKQAIAILSLSACMFVTGSAIAPGLGEIQANFPGAKALYIQMLVSLPAMALVPASILSGFFARRIGMKKLAIWGSLIFLMSGVGAGFVNSIEVMLLFRFMTGLGSGMLLPLPLSLITDFYTGKQMAAMTGYLMGVSSSAGVVVTIAAGILAAINWRLVFLVYIIMLPVLVMSVFWLKAPKPSKVKVTIPYKKEVPIIAFYCFALTTLLFSLPIYIAVHVRDMGFGGSFATSLVLIMPNLGGAIMGSLFVPTRTRFKKQTGPLGLLILAGGFYLISIGQSLSLIVLGALLFGLGGGIIKPLNYYRLANAVTPAEAPISVAITNAFMSLGQFVAPLCYAGLSSLGVVSTVPSVYRFNAILVLGLAVFFMLKRIYFTSDSYCQEVSVDHITRIAS